MAHVSGLAEMMGCKFESMPKTYIGSPLGETVDDIVKWDPI